MAKVRVIVLRAAGINCDGETVHAWRLAGAEPRLVHVNELIRNPGQLNDAQVLTVPGGFSYGDDIAAGRILASRLAHRLSDAAREFIATGKLVLGICNGFQVLVRMGLLPGGRREALRVSLAPNSSSRFEDRWVRLRVETDRCAFLRRSRYIEAPVAHAEGRLVVDSERALTALRENGHVALRYVDSRGEPGDYPANPNGSADGIAGLTDATGQVLGLMPHPERHVDRTQHPLWTRRPDVATADGLDVFRSGVECLK
ncbi:MAG TPA: phosphoribosylformylglycinamidine synthase I [Phycisphaerae bacterium]|nr:phosphoribosylformylglycinamidine synthase I [Phycisphaerae bacterium]